MGKKKKSETHRQRKREISQHQVKELTRDLMYSGEGLPEDVVYEILVRLPAESLVKFRCVSKQWCSLISHPSFQQDHYRIQSQQDPFFLIIRKEFDEVSHTSVLYLSTYDISEETLVSQFSITLPLLPLDSDIILIQSFQGLMCFVDFGYSGRNIFLCNPSTRELIALPPTNEANNCVAFGLTDSRKEVKVVRFFDRKELGGTKTLCEVFSSDTSEWREARHPPPQDQHFSPRAFFLHGAIHLIAHDNGVIHAFDIESEEYRVIPLPEIYDSPGMKYQPHFNEFSGFLCLTVFLDRRYELWLLKDYNNGKWVKEYTIDHFFMGTPSAILGDEILLLEIFVDAGHRGDGGLYCYNLRDRTYTQKLDCHHRAKATSYVGSLFALGR